MNATAGTTTVWFSLRRQLLVLLLGGLSACWLIAVAFIWHDSHNEIDELFDAQLAQTAQALLTQAGASDDHGHEPGDMEELGDFGEIAHKYQRHIRCQIWRSDGRLLLRSHGAPETPMTRREGFSEEDGREGHWRYFSQWNAKHTLQVQVAEDHRVRDGLVAHIATRLLLPALAGLVLIALWVWLATRQSLTTLDQLARQIDARAPQQLQPVVPARAPTEIRPMIDALNDLFQRVDQALEAERRFTADAAHELRTPLAALQAQAQVALRARDDAERSRSLQQLRQGLERSSHLVDQMLALARLDPEAAPPDWAEVDLSQIVAEACAEVGPLILERALDFSLDAPSVVLVPGHADWLRLLVRNLVDNAARYAPQGGHVEVRITPHEDWTNICVSDDGPGIPPEERARVLHRFYRLGNNDMPGSGLGLSIVARIAELHGARFLLGESSMGGLAAYIDLPRVPPA